METRNSLLEKIEESREEFLDFLDRIEDQEFSKSLPFINPVNNQPWSIKDIIIHLSRWEAELIKLMWQLEHGVKPTGSPFSLPQNKVDDLNNQWQAESKGRLLAQAMDDFLAVRNQTLLRLEAFSDKDLFDNKRFGFLSGRSLSEIIANNTYEHEKEHLRSIKSWKTTLHET